MYKYCWKSPIRNIATAENRIYVQNSLTWIKVELTLEQAMQAQGGGSIGADQLLLNLGARRGSVVKARLRQPYPRKRTLPIAEGAGWAQGPIQTGMEKIKSLAHTSVLTPNRPARSASRYSGPTLLHNTHNKSRKIKYKGYVTCLIFPTLKNLQLKMDEGM